MHNSTTLDAVAVKLAGKLALILALVCLGLFLVIALNTRAFATTTVAAEIVAPRNEVVLQSADIKLGDVFSGVVQNADFVLAPAPALGGKMVWNAATLQKIAAHFNLPWQASPTDSVQISRAADLIAPQSITDVVTTALRDKGLDGRFAITLSNLPETGWLVASATRLNVESLTLNADRTSFRTVIRAGRDSLVSDGQLIALVSVPTLRRTVAAGEILADSDFTFIDMKLSDMRKGTQTNLSDLIGMTPRRALSIGAVIKDGDVMAPRLVKRGDVVNLMFKNARMQLSTQAKALEDGVLGGRIRVANLKSNRTLEGEVSRNGDVIITN